MNARNTKTLACVLALVCVTGCASSTATRDNWTYVGNDKALAVPPTMRVGDDSDPVWRRDARELTSAWMSRRFAAADAAKRACAAETGKSATPDGWSGHDPAFMACMKGQGWVAGGSNPL